MQGTSQSRVVAEVDFAKNGRQHGFLRLFHSVHSSAYGFIPIPIVVLKNGDGPTALLVSGTHGDEYEGQVALCNLVKSLDPARLQGRVIIVSAANFPAAIAGRRTSPIDEGNLNRLFPGDADGTVTQQIAYYIEHELVPMADMICDLHSGGSSLMYVPSALFGGWQPDGSTARAVEALKAFGSPVAYVAEENQGGNRTLSGGAARHGKICLGTEAGGSGHVTRSALRMVERGVNNVLVHMGILPQSARIVPDGPTRLPGSRRRGLLRLCAGERPVRAAGGTRRDGARRPAGSAHPLAGDAVGRTRRPRISRATGSCCASASPGGRCGGIACSTWARISICRYTRRHGRACPGHQQRRTATSDGRHGGRP